MQGSTVVGQDWHVEVFFDGACPFCRREMNWLQRLDRRKQIRFTDISAPDFSPADYHLTMDDFMAEIQGRLPDGSWLHGVEVFRQLYQSVGWGWLVSISRWPLCHTLLDMAYRRFARFRWQRAMQCATDQCRVGNFGKGEREHEPDEVIDF